MKDSDFLRVVKEETEALLDVLLEVQKTDIKPLTAFGNPEKTIGKPYEEWTGEELQKAAAIHGPKLMESFIAKHEVEILESLEREEV